MEKYVDLDSNDGDGAFNICTQVFLVKKFPGLITKVKGVPLSDEDLVRLNGARFFKPATIGDVAIGKAVFDGEKYVEVYEPYSQDHFVDIEIAWCNKAYEESTDKLARIQDGHRTGKGSVPQWRAFRNDLRDYPQNVGFPDVVANPRPVEPV